MEKTIKPHLIRHLIKPKFNLQKIILISLVFLFSSCINNNDNETNTNDQPGGKFGHKHFPLDHDLIIWENSIDTILSLDSIQIVADITIPENYHDMILLCHQANSSRGEYIETAKILAQEGFASIAIDLRSGDKKNGVVNHTTIAAKNKNFNTDYINAIPDIEAGINFAYQLNDDNPIICLGSSYSASLILLMAKNNEKIKALACFSPGEYLKDVSIHDSIIGLSKPIFITCANHEIEQTKNLIDSIPIENSLFLQPETDGMHGSSALWETNPDNNIYWTELKKWLLTLNP